MKHCPHCDATVDPLRDRPALTVVGWNPHTGVLYRCRDCGDRVTEAEIETGEPPEAFVDEESPGFEPTPYAEYRETYQTAE